MAGWPGESCERLRVRPTPEPRALALTVGGDLQRGLRPPQGPRRDAVGLGVLDHFRGPHRPIGEFVSEELPFAIEFLALGTGGRLIARQPGLRGALAAARFPPQPPITPAK